MKRTYLLCYILFTLVSNLAYSQKEATHWVFGDGVHLVIDKNKFQRLSDVSLTSYEGCSSISDSTGNLLYYSNGVDVYDGKHQPINGSGFLKSYLSCAQSSVFIKANRNEYFLITNNGLNGLYYSRIVYNEKTGNSDFEFLNKKLWCSVTEQMASFTRSSDNKTWLITHESIGNKFLSILFGNFGPEKIIESPVGIDVHPSKISPPISEKIGMAKISPDGHWLAVTNRIGNRLDLFCFNQKSGAICNQLELISNHPWIYGLEFSSSSNRLFVGNVSVPMDTIYQFDLNKSLPDIKKSIQVVAISSKNNGGIQLGVDGNIYLFGPQFIGKISNPDSTLPYFNYNDSFLNLVNRQSQFATGLPSFSASFFSSTQNSVSTVACSCMTQSPSFQIPNVLTPNGDGLNDVLSFKDVCIGFEYYNLEIYNRYGQLMFNSDDVTEAVDCKGWVAGVYYVVFKYALFLGLPQKYTGTLTIIR